MKHAHITPNSLFQVADRYNDMHLVLIQWIKENEEYCRLITDSKVYKILDNGFYELRETPTNGELLLWAETIGADEIVAPDEMYNYSRTKRMVEEFIDTRKKLFSHLEIKIQAVVCGRTKQSMIQCYKEYLENIDIDVISFSRRGCAYGQHDIERFKLIQECLSIYKKRKPIHLLGANGIADYLRKWPKPVRSMDSKQFAKAVLLKEIIPDVSATPNERLVFTGLVKKLKNG